MPKLTISEPNKAPQPYGLPIDMETISVGSGAGNDITIDHPSLSESHCRIERVEGGYIIRNLESVNGVKQGDISYRVVDLYDKSEVSIGEITLMLELSAEEIAVISEEEYTAHLEYAGASSPQQNVKSPLATPAPSPSAFQQSPSILAAGSMVGSAPSIIKHADNSSSSALTALFLAIVALVAGMCIRHQLDTGEFLLSKLLIQFLEKN